MKKVDGKFKSDEGSKAPTIRKPILLSLAGKNWLEWADYNKTVNMKSYGKAANTIKTGVEYVPPVPQKEDYLVPKEEEDFSDYTAAEEAPYRKVALTAWVKEKVDVKKSNIELYAIIWDQLNSQSTLRIKNEEEFDEDEQDYPKLCRLIHKTHHKQTSGTSEVAFLQDKRRDKKVFEDLAMGSTESIQKFKERYDVSKQEYLASGHTITEDESEEAFNFMYLLDTDRYGPSIASMTNQAKQGMGQLPATVYDMYIAMSETVVLDPSRTGNYDNVFVAIDKLRKPKADQEVGKIGGGRRSTSPNSKKRLAKFKREKAASDSGKSANEEQEWRSCRGCFKKGHIMKNCPDNPANAEKADSNLGLTTTTKKPQKTPKNNLKNGGGKSSAIPNATHGHNNCNYDDDESDDEEEHYSSDDFAGFTSAQIEEIEHQERKTVLVHNEVRESAENNRVLFGKRVIVWDGGAGRSVFRDKELLQDIHRVKKWYMGGVNAESPGLAISSTGKFKGIGKVAVSPDAAANILAQGPCIDMGMDVNYLKSHDKYTVTGPECQFLFTRKEKSDGTKSPHYTCEIDSQCDDSIVLIDTIEGNMSRLNLRQKKEVREAEKFKEDLGRVTSSAAIAVLGGGVSNTTVTPATIQLAEETLGPAVGTLKGSTTQKKIKSAGQSAPVRTTQVEQNMSLDLFYIKNIIFILGTIAPLGLLMCMNIANRTAANVAKAIRYFRAAAMRHNFDITELRSDNEGGVLDMAEELSAMGINVNEIGAGSHVPEAERPIRTIKERVRNHEHGLPYVMCRLLLIFCVLFCVDRLNLQPRSGSGSLLSPSEQFSQQKLDAKRDLRAPFGAYAQATEPYTDNTMKQRTQGCISLKPTGNRTGSVKFYVLRTGRIVTRDNFTILPMPDVVIGYLNLLAEKDHMTRGGTDTEQFADLAAQKSRRDGPRDVTVDGPQLAHRMPVYGRAYANVQPMLENLASAAGVEMHDGSAIAAPTPNDTYQGPRRSKRNSQEVDQFYKKIDDLDEIAHRTAVEHGSVANNKTEDVVTQQEQYRPTAAIDEEPDPQPRDPPPITAPPPSPRYPSRDRKANTKFSKTDYVLVMETADDLTRAELRKQLALRAKWRDGDYAFTMSVKAAVRERGDEAGPVIMAELQQMEDKKVWHGVSTKGWSKDKKRAIIRSSMFLKDKYFASGAFDRFKARLVAGGDGQDKELYDNLSSPTVATTSVLTIAAIAAAEKRIAESMDIGGAFLNADIKLTGVIVNMRLNSMITAMMVKINPEYESFVEADGTMVVELDKALYGCVEAAKLWYDDLRGTLIADGFVENPYDNCVFNKLNEQGQQITIALHVDDLLVTCVCQETIDQLYNSLTKVYPEIKRVTGQVLDYVGMTFDFRVEGEVSVTMENMVNDILSDCGVTKPTATPASNNLFEVRDAEKVTPQESKFFHSYVAKVLYLAKRVRPECLTAVGFLTTRVHECDTDDMSKLHRLLGYILGTRDRGITLRVGEKMEVKAYIDAAYGVHAESGKSHTGCAIVLGAAGCNYAKSAKQKIVTKSSTEAELVGLSDTASQAIHTRNFVIEQGYDVGPAIIYQDNMSCMALMKRGGPGSERSRHINIRHFWLKEKTDSGEVLIQHLGTKEMHANVLTKPVQGAQFVTERQGLTNWRNTE